MCYCIPIEQGNSIEGRKQMPKYLATNENGDWWEFDSDLKVGDTVWVIETSQLETILSNEEDRLNSETDIYALDKLERDIREHGDPYSMTDIV
jgi:hypothetical protein